MVLASSSTGMGELVVGFDVYIKNLFAKFKLSMLNNFAAPDRQNPSLLGSLVLCFPL